MSRMSTVKRLGRVNTTHRFEDQCEMDEGYEHNVELVEAGQIDGSDFFGIYRHIMLPLSAPGFVVVAIWQFMDWTRPFMPA